MLDTEGGGAPIRDDLLSPIPLRRFELGGLL
jgi:hypothetical protein